jgi:hypothetical protein
MIIPIPFRVLISYKYKKTVSKKVMIPSSGG